MSHQPICGWPFVSPSIKARAHELFVGVGAHNTSVSIHEDHGVVDVLAHLTFKFWARYARGMSVVDRLLEPAKFDREKN